MAGDFLPPVVTYLKGNIDDLVDKVNEARALIKSLGSEQVTVNVKFNIDQSSLLRATGGAKALTGALDGLNRANVNLNKNMSYDSGGRRMPGWFGWLMSLNPDTLHASVVGLMAVGAALTGVAAGAGALAAVWSKGAAQAAEQATALFVAGTGMGTPINKLFGLNSGGALGKIMNADVGQVYSFLGGIQSEFNKNGPMGAIIGNEGSGIGAWFDEFIAKMNLAKSTGVGFQQFLTAISHDAVGVGAAFKNLGDVVGKTIAAAPGEIEWLTTGLGAITGGAASLFSNSNWFGKNIGSRALEAFMVYHTASLLSGAGGYGLGAILSKLGASQGLISAKKYESMLAAGEDVSMLNPVSFHTPGTNIKSIMNALTGKGGAALSKEDAAFLEDAGIDSASLGAVGIGGAATFGIGIAAAAALAGGLAAYRYQTPTSGRIRDLMGSINKVTPDAFSGSILGVLGHMAQGAYAGASGPTLLGRLVGGGLRTSGLNGSGVEANILNVLTLGSTNKSTATSFQYKKALGNIEGSLPNYGRGLNAVAAALGVSPSVAEAYLQQAGVTVLSNGKFKGGTATAIQQAKNYLNAFKLLTGNTGEAGANMAAYEWANGINYKNASSVNSSWDSYISSLTAGGTNLQSLYGALGKKAPKQLASFFNTSTAVSGEAEPLLDFYRTAQSMGVGSGAGLTKYAAQVAASLAPIAGNSAAAKAQLLALANESGAHFTSWAQLMKAAGGTASAALKGVTSTTESMTQKMGVAGPFIQQVMSNINSDTTAAFASILAKSAPANRAFDNLLHAMETTGDASKQTRGAIAALTPILEHSGLTAQQINTIFGHLGITWQDIHPGTKNLNFASNAPKVKNDIWQLIETWAKVPNGQVKTMTAVIANEYETVYKAGQAPLPIGALVAGKRHAFGVSNAAAGWSLIGENGPELRYLNNGDTIIPNHYARQALSGTGSPAGVSDIHNHIYIDGKEMLGVVKKQTYDYNVKNGNRRPDGRVNGTMVPR